MDRRRVVATGIGVISCIGNGKKHFAENLRSGASGIAPISSFDTEPFSTDLAGCIDGFDPHDYVPARKVRRTHRCAQFALACACQAMDDARLLGTGQVAAERVGVCMGTAIGGMSWALDQQEVFLSDGPRRVSPYTAAAAFCGAISAEISIAYGLRGPSMSISNGCTSSLDAISLAFDLIRRGAIDVAVAGGAEACLTPSILAAFDRIRVLTARRGLPVRSPSPFDSGRDGIVLSEGGAAIVLEELSSALRRGATVYGEVLGSATTCDAHNDVAPLPSGEQRARCMESAIASSAVPVEAIDLVSAHGTGTRLNDEIETLAIRQTFGKHAHHIPVTAMKSMLGHALGACGAIEMAGVLLAMQHGFIPPTVNYRTRDPRCDLDYVPNNARLAPVRAALLNSFSFGGKNASLVVAEWN